MTALALVVGGTDVAGAGWVHGLELVAVPVVLLALLAMRRTLAPDRPRLALAAAGLLLAVGIGGFAGQAAAIAFGAIVGVIVFSDRLPVPSLSLPVRRRRALAVACLATLGMLLLGLPLLQDVTDVHAVALVDAMVRSGSFVFGGGHVVLPLLDQALVEPGWVSEQDFLAGYGLAQAMPGPLFTFSAYLGAIEDPAPNGVAGAGLALVAIYLPSFLILGGVLPFWSSIRRQARVQPALVGVTAAVVGVLAAAFWDPILTGSIDGVGDVVFALALLGLLRVIPIWAVVPLAAAAGAIVF
jgi:chromate transporter